MIRFPITDNFSAYRALEALSEAFSIPCPKLRWSPKTYRGVYRYRLTEPLEEAVISIGPKTWTGVEASLIHEFSHHLDRARNGRNGTGHGPSFQQALLDTVSKWYGDVHLYPWKNEYATVKAAGPKKPLDIDQVLQDIDLN